MLEKDIGKMLFPDSSPQMPPSSTGNTQKYMDPTASFDIPFRNFTATSSDPCCYTGHPFGVSSEHQHSGHPSHHQTAGSERPYPRSDHSTSGIPPQSPLSTFSNPEDLSQSVFPHSQHQQQSVYGDPMDSKHNINIYQSLPSHHHHQQQQTQAPQAHMRHAGLDDPAMMRRAGGDARQARFQGYGAYGQAFYCGLQGADRQGLSPMETGYPLMGRSMFHTDLGSQHPGRHFGRRPSLTIPIHPDKYADQVFT